MNNCFAIALKTWSLPYPWQPAMLMLPKKGKNKLIKDSTEVVAYVIKFKTETKTPNENKLMFQNYEIANNEITNQSKGN